MDKINVAKEIACEINPLFVLEDIKEAFANKSNNIGNFASLITQ